MIRLKVTVRAIDYCMQTFAIATAVTLVVASNTVGLAVLGANLFAVGLWGILYPPGILGWAKTQHRELDPSDQSLWWVTRLIGSAFIAISIVLVIAVFFR